jgi:thiamine biosynthesis protein ThiS
MTFTFNGEPRAWWPTLTLETLLLQEGYATSANLSADDANNCACAVRAGVAVSIAQQVVPRSTWAQRLIAPQDQIELFQAIAGG